MQPPFVLTQDNYNDILYATNSCPITGQLLYIFLQNGGEYSEPQHIKNHFTSRKLLTNLNERSTDMYKKMKTLIYRKDVNLCQ